MPAATAEFEIPELVGVTQPIQSAGAEGRHLLSMAQLDQAALINYLDTATATEAFIKTKDPISAGFPLTPGLVLKAVMRQPSTRTGGSMTTAMAKLGGFGELISGMNSSSEAKGETVADSWAAFATQSDILGIRTAEVDGPRDAAEVIELMIARGQIDRVVPVINLGDGTAEHPTQTLGDLFTIKKVFGDFASIKLTVVGDHERYRAFHSLLIGAATVGMEVVAVESEAAPVPKSLRDLLGSKLTRVPAKELNDVLELTDVLYIGRNPDEYDGDDQAQIEKSKILAKDYDSWIMTQRRLQTMPEESIVLHARPRRTELPSDCDDDPRMRDVRQMDNMIAMRAGIIALHLGKTIPFSA